MLNYLINESQKARLSGSSEGLSDVALQFAVTEAIKLMLSLVYYVWRRPQLRGHGNHQGNGIQESRHDEEEQPLKPTARLARPDVAREGRATFAASLPETRAEAGSVAARTVSMEPSSVR